MDPLTHALSGAVLVQTLPQSVRPRWMFLWGAFVAASPDLDLSAVHNSLQYIERHRTVTHSLLGACFEAALLGAVFLLLIAWQRRKSKVPNLGAAGGWTFLQIFSVAYLLLLLHIWLDCVTSYGTQVFWPFNDCRVRLSGLFIISPLVLLPLAAGLIWKRNNRRVMTALLIWTLVYPAAAVAGRVELERSLAGRLSSEAVGFPVQGVHLVPDAFSPYYWKLIVRSGSSLRAAGYRVGGGVPKNWERYAVPPPELWKRLGKESRMFQVYERFAQYPVLVRESARPDASGGRQYVFADLRFGSTIKWVDDIEARAGDEDRVFEISARLDPDGRLAAVRLVAVKGAGGDSGWLSPQPDLQE